MVVHAILQCLQAAWGFLLEASVYVLFGLLVSGLLRVFLDPGLVARHLGTGRFKSVFKAALLGIPIPLCSCGVLPAAVSLRKQGASRGATTAFLISTPESGVDSISVTYALLDPVMTAARPLAAFITAAAAGILENLFHRQEEASSMPPDRSCPVDGCCDGTDCPPSVHRRHHTFLEKVRAGCGFALREIWGDMAGWFFIGLLLAGLLTTLFPTDVLARVLGGGLPSMLFMLVIGIPLYICATASTPIAAALVLQGASPGAALVFLLAGPATNITSLTVLFGTLGKRATAIYLTAIAVSALVFGLVLDEVYGMLGLSAQAMAGEAGEIIPRWAQWGGAVVLLLISVKPVGAGLRSRLSGLMARRGTPGRESPGSFGPTKRPASPPTCPGST